MAVTPKSLDHVALWVADRDALSDVLCESFGMHVIERTDTFTLVGADARQGKLTLFAAEGPRDPGALRRVVLRVPDLDEPTDVDGPEGLGLGLVSGRSGGLAYDLDHVVMRVADSGAAAARLTAIGFAERDGRLWIGDRSIVLEPGGQGSEPEAPLLNHLALLVDSVDEHLDAARSEGFEVTDIKDAANTYAGFIRGPEGIRIEFVEHKPTFSLV